MDAAAVPALLKVSGPSTAAVNATIEIFRNLSRISSQTFGVEHANAYVLNEYDTPGTTTFTPTYSAWYRWKGCGAGGGGGQGASASQAGGGGGGSGKKEGLVYLTSGLIYEIIVPAGGAYGAPTSNGTAGGDTILRRQSDSAIIVRLKGGSVA